MDGDHVFWVCLEKAVHVVDQFEEQVKRRSMVVLPREVHHVTVEHVYIVNLFAQVENAISVRVVSIEELLDIGGIIPIHGLH